MLRMLKLAGRLRALCCYLLLRSCSILSVCLHGSHPFLNGAVLGCLHTAFGSMLHVTRVNKKRINSQIRSTRVHRLHHVANGNRTDVPAVLEKSGGEDSASDFVESFSGLVPAPKRR